MNNQNNNKNTEDNEYVIINDCDLFNFIYKFDSNGNVDKYIKNMISQNGIEDDSYISYFDMEEYIDDILKSYSNNYEKILYQFGLDYHRINIKLNGYKHENKELFLNNLNFIICNTYNFNIKKFSLDQIIVLLCCQSSFYLPYQILSNLYCTNKDINKDTNVLVCDSNNIFGLSVNIIIDKSKITIELNNELFIKNINNNINTHKINSTLSIQIENKENKDNKENNNIYLKYGEPHICIFNWKIMTTK